MSSIFSSEITVKNFIKFVWPSIMMMVIIAFKYNMDSILAANMLGEIELAALSMAYPIQGIMWGIGVMLASGSSAVVAIKMGEGKQEEANSKFTSICVLSVFVGVIYFVIILLFMNPIIDMTGADAVLEAQMKEFLWVFVFCIPGAFLGLIFEYFIRVDGSPGYTLVLYVVDTIAHLAVILVMCGPMGMGMAGIAWGNVIGLYVMLATGLVYFLGKRKKRIRFRRYKNDWRFIGHCFVNGSSEMVTESSAGITTFCFNLVVINLAGATGVAAVSVMTNLHYFIISIFLGYIAGISPLISYFYGAKEYEKVNQIIGYSKRFIAAAGIIMAIVCVCFAGILVRLFEEPGTELYDMAVIGVRCLAPAVLLGGINIFGSGFFTAYGNGKISAVISAGRALIFLVIGIFALSWILGMTGIWLAISFAEILTLAVTFFMFRKFKDVYHYRIF